jgi:hypothetical protein
MNKALAAAAAVLALAGCTQQEEPPEYWPMDQSSAAVVEVPAGQPFDYAKTYNDDTPPTDWRVQLTQVRCGLDTIRKGAPNPKWQGEDDVPEYVTAKAAPGKQFCMAYWDWTNTGDAPGNTDDAGDIVVGGQRFTREDVEISDAVETTHLKPEESGLYEAINPGDKAKSIDVYVVPAGSVAEAVWFPMATVDGDSHILVAAR